MPNGNEFAALEGVVRSTNNQVNKLKSWIKSNNWNDDTTNPFSQYKTLVDLNNAFKEIRSNADEKDIQFVILKYREQRVVILQYYVDLFTTQLISMNEAIETGNYKAIKAEYVAFNKSLKVLKIYDVYPEEKYPKRNALCYQLKKKYTDELKNAKTKLDMAQREFKDKEKLDREQKSKNNVNEAVDKFNNMNQSNKGTDSPQIMRTLKVKK